MTFRPLGPDGVAQRMRTIEARLDSVLGPRPTPPLLAAEFQETLGESAQKIGTESPNLSGAIGSGVRPMSPFGVGKTHESSGPSAALRSMIQNAAGQAGVDPILFESLIATESNFDARAVSSKGAIGLAQLMPGTAKALGIHNPMDPEQNLRGGALYLSQMLKQFGGDMRLALAAYNAGPGAVTRHGGIPPFPETQKYVEKVLAQMNSRRQS